jgi:uncharacterized FlaG/YvyC family protein
MCEEYYAKVGVPVRQSVMLQSHFVELYSGFKNGIHGLTLIVSAPKCPASFVNDDTEVNNYIENLQEYLLNSKKIPNKCWSSKVVQLLLQLHLEYVKDFGGSQQGISFVESKKQQNKSKFYTDQQNRETELARKRAVEEEERVAAASNRREVAEQSKRMADCLEKLVTPTLQDITKVVDEKLQAHQAQVTQSAQKMLGNFLAEIKDAIHENRTG